MRERINMTSLWRRAKRKVLASFEEHGEPVPPLASECPFTLAELVDPNLDIGHLVAAIGRMAR